MAKFSNTTAARPAPTSPVKTVGRTTTHEHAIGFARDAKSDLFLLAVSNFVSEDTFYEKAGQRDGRFADLVRDVTLADADWVARFVPWLRNEANMRSASIVMAAESAAVRLAHPDQIAAQLPTSTVRSLVNSAMSRADEPAEFVAYWTQRFGRKSIPGGVQRGVQDAVKRLYTEYAALKYDGLSRGFRMGDVLNLAHPGKRDDWQGDLFEYLLDRRHHGDVRVDLSRLPMIKGYRALMEVPVPDRRKLLTQPHFAERLKDAGMTWEDLSGWLQGPMDAEAWEAIIPSMGYMALLRNLRNFDEAGVSDAVADTIIAKLVDPAQVARSRQLPFRFLSAYVNAPHDRWKHPLGKALDLATQNIPTLNGKSLLLIDTSASMNGMGYSARSEVTPAKAAALFAITLAKRQNGSVRVMGFADGAFEHVMKPGATALSEIERFLDRTGEVGHGTNIPGALNTYRDERRVFIFSDMQTMGRYGHGGSHAVPDTVPLYGFNLVGYGPTAIESGTPYRHEIGGLSDRTFALVSQLEAGAYANWPF